MIAGVRSGERALAVADATGEAMGKTVIRAKDGPGFLVNRCNRPFGLEALRLLRRADRRRRDDRPHLRLGGGFRMGPFELSDLVGVDTGFDVPRSFYELSFGEPRWRPSPIQAQMVAAGLHGRKTGHGYYDYSGEGPHRDADPEPPARSADALIQGKSPLSGALLSLASGQTGPDIDAKGLGGTVDGEPFYAIVPLGLVEVTGEAGEQAFRGLGLHTARVRPSPGGVLPRIVCQVINECAFALGEGVGRAEDIDTGMVLGMNYPRGPFAWASEIGLDDVWRCWRSCGRSTERSATALPRRSPHGARGQAGRPARTVLPEEGVPASSARGRVSAASGYSPPPAVCTEAGAAQASSARSPIGMPAGVGTPGVSRRYHSASSAAWQPDPAAVTAWR